MSEMEPKGNSKQYETNARAMGIREDQTRYYTEIDWRSLILRLLEKIHWILLSAAAGGALAAVVVLLLITPIYQATSKLYIAGSEDAISMSDIQLGSVLAVDYQEVFKIADIHEMVAQRLDLDYSVAQMERIASRMTPPHMVMMASFACSSLIVIVACLLVSFFVFTSVTVQVIKNQQQSI